MNITLTAKDADFILKYLRTDLERVSECTNKIVEKQNRFREQIKESGLEDDCAAMMLADGLLSESEEMIAESEDIKKDLTKCIELLTCGSEANGAA